MYMQRSGKMLRDLNKGLHESRGPTSHIAHNIFFVLQIIYLYPLNFTLKMIWDTNVSHLYIANIFLYVLFTRIMSMLYIKLNIQKYINCIDLP